MNWLIALLAAVVGYLCGSISFARIVVGIAAPGEEITGMEFEDADSGETYHVAAVSGTAVSMKLGAKYGSLTGLLDMLKVTIPTLAFRFGFPEAPYFLLTAAMGLVGHNWPLYHRFKGGRGISPIYGGMLATDWVGSLVTAFGGMIVGLVVLRNLMLSFSAGLWLMIPWLWIRTHDLAHVAYAVFINVIYSVAMIPEFRRAIDYSRRGVQVDFSRSMESIPMARMLKKMVNRVGLFRDES